MLGRKEYVVYLIHHEEQDKKYVGYTHKYEQRAQQHFNPHYWLEHPTKMLYEAMLQYPNDTFTMYPLISHLTGKEARYAEAYIINNKKTYPPYGYNVNREREYLKAKTALDLDEDLRASLMNLKI